MEHRLRLLLRAVIAFICALFGLLVAGLVTGNDWFANAAAVLMVAFVAVAIPMAVAVAAAFDLGSAMPLTSTGRRLLIAYTHVAVVGGALLATCVAVWTGRLLGTSWATSAVSEDVWDRLAWLGGEGRVGLVVIVVGGALSLPYVVIRARARVAARTAAPALAASALPGGLDGVAARAAPWLHELRAHFTRAAFAYLAATVIALVVALATGEALASILVFACAACVLSCLCVRGVSRLVSVPWRDAGSCLS